ncbi:mitochondrial carrier protein [Fragilaria crotonensis]|nr:mitochondrial carrier protein [Fragilaria crotonensis]
MSNHGNKEHNVNVNVNDNDIDNANSNNSHTYSFAHLRLGEEALGGLSAGIIGTVIGFPLDVIKTRLQTGSKNMNMIQMASRIVRTEGILSLYKGIVPPLLSLSLINTLSFTSYSYFRRLYGGTNGWDGTNSLAGMTGCPIFSLVTTPENFIKTQMQLDNVHHHQDGKKFRGSFHCASVLIKHHGLRVMYTGHVVNTVREGSFLGCYFYIYEGLRQLFTSSDSTTTTVLPVSIDNKIAIPLAGGLAGASAWFFSFPLDCIRAGVQGRDLSSRSAVTQTQQQRRRQGAIQVFLELIQSKGFLGLYRGVGPSIARAFLVSGTRFSAYEGALWLLRGGRDNVDY